MKRNITQVKFDDVILVEQDNPSKSSNRTFLKYSLFLLLSTLILNLSSFAQISGIKTVGTGGNYQNLTQAFADITAQTLNGAIDLQLTTGYPDAPETFPLVSPSRTVIGVNNIQIYPIVSGLSINGSSATGILNLTNTKNIILDGRVGAVGSTNDLLISNSDITTGYAIQFVNDATNNLIQYCNVRGSSTTLTTGVIAFGSTTNTIGNNSNTITNCNISNAGGSALPTVGIYSLGSVSLPNTSNTISNNNIFNFFNATTASQGISLNAGNTTWSITGNSLYQTATRTGAATAASTCTGILISNTAGNTFTITGNYIGGSSASCGGGPWTLTVGTPGSGTVGLNRVIAMNVQVGGTTAPTTTSIQNNTIQNFNITTNSQSNPTFAGMLLQNGSYNVGTVTGNKIGDTTGTGSISVTLAGTVNSLQVYGIWANNIGTTGFTGASINITNNNLGSFTLLGNTANISLGFEGIIAIGTSAAGAGTHSITFNKVGSVITPNNINSSTVSVTGNQLMRGIDVQNSLNTTGVNINIAVNNNIVANINQNGTTVAGSNNRGIVYSASAVNGTVTINNNRIFNISGAGAIPPTVTTQGAIVGIVNFGTGSLLVTISGNEIHSIYGTNTGALQYNVVGIVTSNATAVKIFENKIYDLRNASTSSSTTNLPVVAGILYGASGSPHVLANNMITLGNGTTTNTLFCGIVSAGNSGGGLQVYYNSIKIMGSAASGSYPSFGFLRTNAFSGTYGTGTGGTAVTLRNNLIVNVRNGGTGKHYALGDISLSGNSGSWGNASSNFNILNAPNSTQITAAGTGPNGTDYSFAGYKAYTAGDAASISAATVVFQDESVGDLHINMPFPTGSQMESNGTPIVAAAGPPVISYTINTDIDGNNRPGPTGSVNGGGTIPDIGADEYDGVILDIATPNIAYTALNNTSLTGGETLSNFATITDLSGVNTTVGTRPRLYFKRSTDTNVFNDNTSGTAGWKYDEANNTGPQFSFSINYGILSGGGVPPIGTIIQYFVVAEDNATPTNIGINSGTFASAPTSVALITANLPTGTINTYKITQAIASTVSVGTGGTYTSLTNAGGLFDNINNGAFTGSVTASIISDLASESGTFALNQIAEDGVGGYFLTVKPSGVARVVSGIPTGPSMIKLNGADRVKINGSLTTNGTDRSLTIANYSQDYDLGNIPDNCVIHVSSPTSSNGATSNTIKNCIIRGLSNEGTEYAISQGGSDGGGDPGSSALSPNSNNTYQNNVIFASNFGLFLNGSSATSDQNTVISGNTIGSPVASLKTYYAGFWSQGQAGMQITDNNILGVASNINPGFAVCGIFINSVSTNLILTGNNIYDISTTSPTAGAAGIRLGAFGATSTNMLVANNTISNVSAPGTVATPTETNNAYGILISNAVASANAYKIYYNSVNLNVNQTSGISSAFMVLPTTIGAGAIDLRNNVFANTQTTNSRYCIYLVGTSPAIFSNINRNDYYGVSGVNVGFLTSARANLAAWQGASLSDANSISADPKFNTPTVLGPLVGSPLIGAGQFVPEVLKDQIGITRSLSTPSIGAYENTGDYAPPAFVYTKLPFTCGSGNVILNATITDFSGVNITATYLPRIYFSKNSGSYFSTAGTQLTGSPQNGNWNFTINTTTLGGVTVGDKIHYFLIAQDRAPNINVGTSPVGGFGSDVNAVTAYPIPDSFSIVNPLAPGTYTVGTGGAYATLTAAVADYNTKCLSGAVTFSLLNTSYTTGTGETMPITIRENPYGSSTNTLTIKPATGVTAAITGTGSRVLVLSGADYVTIDGSNNGSNSRNLTLSSSSTTTGAIVYFMNSLGTGKGATNNVVKNSIIQTGSKGTGASAGTLATLYGIYSGDGSGNAGPDNDNFTVDNDSFRLTTIGLFGLSDATGLLDNWTITNNKFGDAISYNSSLGRTGVSISFANTLNVTGNTFANIGAGDAGTSTGLNIGSTVSNITIRKNVFKDITYSGSTSPGYGGRGISLNTALAATNAVIDNNSISNISGTGSNDITVDAICGIRILGTTGGVKMYYNSINLGSGTFAGNANGILSSAIYVGASATAIDMRNNLLNSNLQNSGAAGAKTYALYSDAASSAFTTINNNNYSVSGTQGILGFIGSARSTLAAMVTGFGQNANSVSAIPVFTSATDLHLTAAGNCGLDNKAQYLSAYTTDFDGQTRASGINKPDIGFDEFTSSNTQWTGTVSTLWTNAANWCAGLVPDATIDVTIPAGTPFAPALNGVANVKNLILSDGATVNLGTFTLNVAGSFSTPGTGTGAFLGGIYSMLNVTGASTAKLNITGTNVNTVTFNSASGSTITLGTPVNVIGKLDIQGNTLVAGVNNLTFKSNPSGTANLAPVLTGGAVTGTVTVERYIPNNAKRAWRLLSVPVTGAQTFNAAWQEGQAPMVIGTSGLGTLLTKVGGGSGYDAASGNSLLQFTPGSPGSWSAVSSTTNAMQTTAGYFVFVRGDRSALINVGIRYNVGATTLRTKGSLYVGNQTISLPAGNNVLVGNLFASAIDFTLLGGGKTSFKVWDPKAGADSVPGAYQTFSSLNAYAPTPGGGSYIGVASNTRIESGAAFIVSGTGSIVLNETAKVNGSRNTFRSSEKIKQLKTNLVAETKDGSLLLDGNAIVFDAKYSSKVDDLDVTKMSNPNENLSIINNDNQLIIEARGLIQSDDVIQYNLSNLKNNKEYALEFIGDNLDAGNSAYLVDNYLGTTTSIDLSTTVHVKFAVSEAPASYASNRFKVVFKSPVSTEVVEENTISISPNPVTNGQVRVRIADQKEGNYTVRFFNRTGQVILSQVIKHTGSVSVNSLLLNTRLTSGVYQVEVMKPNRERFVQNVVINNTK